MTNNTHPSNLKVRRLTELPYVPAEDAGEAELYAVVDNKDYKISGGVLSERVADELEQRLSPVAFSGEYSDLLNTPYIPAQVNLAEGSNITITGSYPDLTISATGGGGLPGDFSTDDVPEGEDNLYHTEARAAAAAPIQSLVAGANVSIDFSNPKIPVISSEGGGGEIPTGPPRTVFAMDEFGIPGWLPEKRLEGATAWITSNVTLSLNTTNSTAAVPFGDAEQYGQLMWDLDFPTRMYARRDGYYRIAGGFSLATGSSGPRKMRFVRNEGVGGSRYRPHDLTGRVSGPAMTGSTAEPLDFSAVSAPVYLNAGDFMEMVVFADTGVTVQAAGRASWMSMEYLG